MRRFTLDGKARRLRLLQRAEAGGGEIAGDAEDRGAVRTVRRQVDLDDRIIKPGIGGEGRANRRILGQVNDAFVIVGHVELLFGAHHAVAFDTADLADGKRHVDARHIGSRTGERTDHAGARIRRTADDLHRLAVTGIDRQHLQPVGFRMLFRRQDLGDDERLVSRLVIDMLDFEPDRRQALADLVEARIGIEMIFQPGECEFH